MGDPQWQLVDWLVEGFVEFQFNVLQPVLLEPVDLRLQRPLSVQRDSVARAAASRPLWLVAVDTSDASRRGVRDHCLPQQQLAQVLRCHQAVLRVAQHEIVVGPTLTPFLYLAVCLFVKTTNGIKSLCVTACRWVLRSVTSSRPSALRVWLACGAVTSPPPRGPLVLDFPHKRYDG